MRNLITTLERFEDLPVLLHSDADTLLVSVEGLSSSCACKLNPDELKETVQATTEAKKQLAVLANNTLHEGMLDDADRLMQYIATQEEVSVFFADPSIFGMAKKYHMTDRMVYEPETLMTSIPDADWWIQRGVEGICISPILTLQETVAIASTVKKAIVTVHGRTLMSRSYRRLLSAYKDQNHLTEDVVDNRHLCIVEKQREGSMPIYEDETGTLIYSDDVLDSFDFIEDVLKSHPIGLLINGSYMTIEEQLSAVSAYKRILNGEDANTVGKEYREQFKNEPLDSGYYEQKTVK
ncbi:MAG: U32 family peptidase [Lachnospiraceae bacterium]|nr:U32 family peptidase [Lachnospiraceae bacterium]